MRQNNWLGDVQLVNLLPYAHPNWVCSMTAWHNVHPHLKVNAATTHAYACQLAN